MIDLAEFKKEYTMTKDRKQKDEKLKELYKELKNEITQMDIKKLEPKIYASENSLAHKIAFFTLEKELKMAQLRKFFSGVKNIEKKAKILSKAEEIKINEFYLLTPELAYAVGRKVAPVEFYELIKEILKKVNINQDFLNAAKFIEIIVAYARYEEKR